MTCCYGYFNQESVYQLFKHHLLIKYGQDVTIFDVQHDELMKLLRLNENSIPDTIKKELLKYIENLGGKTK